MEVKKLYETYKSLQEDSCLLADVRRKLLQNLCDVGDVDEMINHNYQYRHCIETYITSHIPETFSDLRKISKEDIAGYLSFWEKYPVFYLGNEEKLIGLFWQMSSFFNVEEWAIYVPRIKAICTDVSFTCFAATRPQDDSVVKALFTVVERCTDSLTRYNNVEV